MLLTQHHPPTSSTTPPTTAFAIITINHSPASHLSNSVSPTSYPLHGQRKSLLQPQCHQGLAEPSTHCISRICRLTSSIPPTTRSNHNRARYRGRVVGVDHVMMATLAWAVTNNTSYSESPSRGRTTPSRSNLSGESLSLNHQLEAERQQARDRAVPQRYFEHLRIARGIHQRHGFLSQTIGQIFPSRLFADPTEEEMMDALAFSEFAAQTLARLISERTEHHLRRTTHEYRVAYTHPYPPAPGITHGLELPSPVGIFDVDEEPGPSTETLRIIFTK